MVENLKYLLINLNNNKSIMWVCAQSRPALYYPMYCSPQGSSVHEILRQEYWHGLPYLLQGIFLTKGLNLHLLHWQEASLPPSHLGSSLNPLDVNINYIFLLKKKTFKISKIVRVTLFYIFANFVNVWINSQRCNMLFWLKYVKKIWLYTDM